MDSKVIRAPETLTAQERHIALQISSGHHSLGESGMPLDLSTPDTDKDELEKARQEVNAFYATPSDGVGEAMVLRFLLQNIQGFKLYLEDHPKKLKIAAERWIGRAVFSCEKSRIHAETSQMLGVFSDPELLAGWNTWKTELTAEKDAANSILMAARKNRDR
ncbi:hypothetical protein [Alicycliphilus denitrificans]|uniref:hypothetical protein n=1 Tax=Alicycliphilus denitrificans TaxID=179636 RepID=UPI00384AFFDC